MKKLISLSTYVTFLYNGEAVFANVCDGPRRRGPAGKVL